MNGHTEINYCVYIITDKGTYRFLKDSIYNDVDKWEPSYEVTKSKYAYETFIKLYPFLKLLRRDKIEIVRCWDTFHPTTPGTVYTNEYSKNKDEFAMRLFFDWYNKSLT